jgi:hypothetical protein
MSNKTGHIRHDIGKGLPYMLRIKCPAKLDIFDAVLLLILPPIPTRIKQNTTSHKPCATRGSGAKIGLFL